MVCAENNNLVTTAGVQIAGEKEEADEAAEICKDQFGEGLVFQAEIFGCIRADCLEQESPLTPVDKTYDDGDDESGFYDHDNGCNGGNDDGNDSGCDVMMMMVMMLTVV